MPLSFDPTEDREYTEDQARELWTEARRMAEAGDCDFRGWRFPADPDTIQDSGGFNGITFSGDADFGKATFNGKIDFDGATFDGCTTFLNATFSGPAYFGEATFSTLSNFDEATFRGRTHFNGATFNKSTHFNGATFSGPTHFDGATFSGYTLFCGAAFSGVAEFTETTFSGVTMFSGATFREKIYFWKTTFREEANFDSVTFNKKATFGEVKFNKGARLGSSHIRGAGFLKSNLHNVDLHEADLTDADLRGVIQLRWGKTTRQGNERRARSPLQLLGYIPDWLARILMAGRPFPFVLDDTRIQNARFSSRSADPWSILRRSYSGPMFAIHMLLLVAFVLPLVSRTAFWVATGRAQVAVAENEKVQGVLQQVKATKNKVDEIAEKVTGKQDVKEEMPVEDGRHLKWQKTRVFCVLIGWHQGWLLVLLAISGIAYNAMRFFLTYRVGLLRDREQQSGRSPGKSEYLGLFNLHVAANYLVCLVTLFFVITIRGWLTQGVSVPVY